MGSYTYFLKLLEKSVEQWKIRIHAFSLMPNHYHLLLETPIANISRVMRHVNGVYTQWFNHLHQKDGSLFRGRYKSILVEEDAYLVELLRYIHLNPVKALLVKKPEDHVWTSHRAYLKSLKHYSWLTTERLLRYFGSHQKEARKNLQKFMQEGIPEELSNKLARKKWPSVYSHDNFKDWIYWNFVNDLKDKEIQCTDEKISKITCSRLKKIICETLDSSWFELQSPAGRTQRNKRALAISLVRRHLDYTYSEIAKEFPNIAPSNISRAIKRAPEIDPILWERLQAEIQNEKRKI